MIMSPYEQDICGPCAVPFVWRKCLLLKTELLDSKHDLRASIIQSVGGNILGHILTMSKLTNIQSSAQTLLLFK